MMNARRMCLTCVSAIGIFVTCLYLTFEIADWVTQFSTIP